MKIKFEFSTSSLKNQNSSIYFYNGIMTQEGPQDDSGNPIDVNPLEFKETDRHPQLIRLKCTLDEDLTLYIESQPDGTYYKLNKLDITWSDNKLTIPFGTKEESLDIDTSDSLVSLLKAAAHIVDNTETYNDYVLSYITDKKDYARSKSKASDFAEQIRYFQGQVEGLNSNVLEQYYKNVIGGEAVESPDNVKETCMADA